MSAVDAITPEIVVDTEQPEPAPDPEKGPVLPDQPHPDSPTGPPVPDEPHPDAPPAELEADEDEEKVEEVDVLHVLEPREEHRPCVLVYSGASRSYIQKPLSYFRKMEFFGVVGSTIDTAMEGDDGLTVNALFGANTPTSVGDLSAADFGDLDSFMALVAKVAHYAPEFLKDCYVVWLDVPKSERAWAREALDYIDDDEGQEIIETFVDQNWEAIERFFNERLPALGQRVQARRKK